MATESVRSDRAARQIPVKKSGRFDPSSRRRHSRGALEGLGELGYDRMSMDDIASRARVGKAAIYRRWSSKPAVVARCHRALATRTGPVDPPNTGACAAISTHWWPRCPTSTRTRLNTIKVIVGVATAAMHHPVLAAALDDLALSTPRQMINAVLDQAVARGDIPSVAT